jgi:hypothetical protein
MRTDIGFSLVCSICGGALEADSDKSGFEYSSAYKATASMKIKPCRQCYSKAKEPARLIARAISIIANEEDDIIKL